jgi:hypothetical protein
MSLPPGHEATFQDSLENRAKFVVTQLASNRVEVEPNDGAGVVAAYFTPYRLGDRATDFSANRVWQPLSEHPPWEEKPPVPLPDDAERRLAELRARDDILALTQRLGFDAAQANAAAMSGVFQRELPRLFELYPQGSLWYIGVDQRLLARLSVMRIQLQLSLTPDIDYGAPNQLRYFGVHSTTGGTNFAPCFDHVMLALPPTAVGFDIGVLPHVFVFLFGRLEDLRLHGPTGLAARFFPSVNVPAGVPGLKFPHEGLMAVHFESLLQWWTTRLNVVYSYASDPTNFVGNNSSHNVAGQAAWFLTLERMMADAAVLLAAMDAPPLLRMQAAFDMLDKADSLLTRPGRIPDGTNFKRLLRRDEVLLRLDRAFERLPLQLRPRFKQWAKESYDWLYAEIANTTMAKRVRPTGVRIAQRDPAKLGLRSWDEYVANLVREARNSSHGLQQILQAPPSTGNPNKPDPRLLLATNTGEIPYSLFEVAAVVFLGLMADAEGLCDRTWWQL